MVVTHFSRTGTRRRELHSCCRWCIACHVKKFLQCCILTGRKWQLAGHQKPDEQTMELFYLEAASRFSMNKRVQRATTFFAALDVRTNILFDTMGSKMPGESRGGRVLAGYMLATVTHQAVDRRIAITRRSCAILVDKEPSTAIAIVVFITCCCALIQSRLILIHG